MGIPAGPCEKAFQAFQRVHTGVAPDEGMGLAILRRIVERHGGQVWVESKEGEGSAFLFALPSATSEVAAAEAFPTTGTA